jgi:hypothetical protein
MARTPLAAFFNIPLIMQVEAAMPHGIPLGSYPSHCPTPAGPKPGIYPNIQIIPVSGIEVPNTAEIIWKEYRSKQAKGFGWCLDYDRGQA